MGRILKDGNPSKGAAARRIIRAQMRKSETGSSAALAPFISVLEHHSGVFKARQGWNPACGACSRSRI